jgi:hypothetical protein
MDLLLISMSSCCLEFAIHYSLPFLPYETTVVPILYCALDLRETPRAGCTKNFYRYYQFPFANSMIDRRLRATNACMDGIKPVAEQNIMDKSLLIW